MEARQLLEMLRAQRKVQDNSLPPGANVAASGFLNRENGTVVGNTPAPMATPPRQPASFGTALSGGMAERLIDNTFGAPEAVAKAGLGAVNVGRGLLGMDMVKKGNLLGLPSGRQVLSAGDSLLGRLTGANPSMEAAMANRNQIEQDRPGAVTAGNFLGDAATIAAGRAPMVRGPGGILDEPVEAAVNRLAAMAGNTPKTTGVRRMAEDVLNNDTFREFARATGRSLETGIEGALLSVVQGQDPIETAAVAAGGQLAASFSLGAVKESAETLGKLAPNTISGKLLGLAAAATAATVALQLAKSASIGGDDSIIASEESSFNKLAFSLVLGATAGIAGKRTKADGLLNRFPELADSILTLPRTGLIKFAQQLSQDTDADVERLVSTMQSQPQAFNEKQANKFRAALESEDPLSAVRAMLEEDKKLFEMINAPDPRLAGVPVREDR